MWIFVKKRNNIAIQLYLRGILILNIFTKSSTVNANDSCDVEDEAATSQFFFQIQQCLTDNHNLSEKIFRLNNKFEEIEAKLEENQRTCERQQNEQSKQIQILQEKLLEKLEEVLQEETSRKDIVIQRRMDGSVDFYRTWQEFQMGFGQSSGEFFIGLDKLHKLTNSRPYELLIVLEDWDNERRYAKYDNFVIGSEAEKYVLKSLGSYTGTAGDDFTYNVGQKFSTKDQDNDQSRHLHCAVLYTGAWWHRECYRCNLNGPYKKGRVPDEELGKIVQWHAFRGNITSLKFAEMTIRPR